MPNPVSVEVCEREVNIYCAGKSYRFFLNESGAMELHDYTAANRQQRVARVTSSNDHPRSEEPYLVLDIVEQNKDEVIAHSSKMPLIEKNSG